MAAMQLVVLCLVCVCVSAINNHPSLAKGRERIAKFNVKEEINAGSWSDQISDRLVGGEVAHVSDFPWAAFIWQRKPNVRPQTNAVVVNKYFAITTVRGLYSTGVTSSAKFSIVINTDDASKVGNTVFAVTKVIVHERYNGTIQYDIALLKICPGIESKFHAPLATAEKKFRAGDRATYVTFDLTLKKATKFVGEFCECDTYKPGWTRDQHICIQCHPNIYTDIASNKDYGTVPMMINGQVVALVQISNKNCAYKFGESAINLAKFRSWIDSKIIYQE